MDMNRNVNAAVVVEFEVGMPSNNDGGTVMLLRQ